MALSYSLRDTCTLITASNAVGDNRGITSAVGSNRIKKRHVSETSAHPRKYLFRGPKYLRFYVSYLFFETTPPEEPSAFFFFFIINLSF